MISPDGRAAWMRRCAALTVSVVNEPGDNEPSGQPRRLTSELWDALGRTKEALVLLGLVLYAAVRLGYDGFYGTLGVSISEVGITYSEVITRAALGLALVGSAVIALVAFLVCARGLLRREEPATDVDVDSELLKAIGRVGILLATVAVVLLLASFWLGVDGIVAAAIVGLMGALMAWIGWRAVFTSSARRRLRAPVGLFAVCCCVAAILVGYEQWGEAKARIVQDNRPLRAQPLVGVLNQSADLVCIEWIGEDQPPDLELTRPAVFLGGADGTAVFFRGDPSGTRRGALRLPTAKIAVASATDQTTSCGG